MKLIAYIQHDDDKINPVSLEALQGAQEIANETNGSVIAVTYNPNVNELLINYDVNEIITIDNENLKAYNPLYYLKAMEEIVKSTSPDAIVFGHTYEARDWVPRLSARLDIPFISDCIDYKNEDKFLLTRSVYQGKLNSDISINHDKFIMSFQSGSFKIDKLKEGSANLNKMEIDFSNMEKTINPGEKFQESETSVDLTQAEIIVSVGRGIGKEENLDLVRNLTKALNGELASSRPVVDSGWLESYHQVGSSGQTVSPKLYLAIGISGAIQHVVGMKGAKNIMVINKDANAPLFEIADYGIVGDLFEIVPKLTEMIQNS